MSSDLPLYVCSIGIFPFDKIPADPKRSLPRLSVERGSGVVRTSFWLLTHVPLTGWKKKVALAMFCHSPHLEAL